MNPGVGAGCGSGVQGGWMNAGVFHRAREKPEPGGERAGEELGMRATEKSL